MKSLQKQLIDHMKNCFKTAIKINTETGVNKNENKVSLLAFFLFLLVNFQDSSMQQHLSQAYLPLPPNKRTNELKTMIYQQEQGEALTSNCIT